MGPSGSNHNYGSKCNWSNHPHANGRERKLQPYFMGHSFINTVKIKRTDTELRSRTKIELRWRELVQRVAPVGRKTWFLAYE